MGEREHNAAVADERALELFSRSQQDLCARTDRNFALLMGVQFVAGVLTACLISPKTWTAAIPETHIHVWTALILGGLICGFPIFLAVVYPGRVLTRHVIAVGQMLMGALLIHLTQGRIETHFHVFGSLAFLAFYRDWRVLVTATIVVAVDHFLRGFYWPLSVFGEQMVQPFRWLEHVGWVLFEDLFLFVSIHQSVEKSWTLAKQQGGLERAKASVQSERDEFFDLSLDMLCVAGSDGYFKKLNPVLPKKLGYEMEDLLSQPFLSFVHPDDKERTVQVMRSLRHGKDVVDFENRYRCRDGSYIWLSWSCRAPVNRETMYAVAREVTARKKAAEALETAKRDAEKAREVAEQANRAKSDFLANMSHEIRTPMNAVIGLTELVLETKLTASQRDYLSTVLESGESLLSIINEILDFSKIEAGKIELDLIPMNLREQIGDTMKSLAIRAHRKELELAWHVGKEVPETFLGDPARLRQVLVNLVGNAIKFTPEGEVVLQVRELARHGNVVDLQFEIRDTGVGIPEEKLGRIFAEFEQADTSTTREFGGTGLGLSISSRLVDLMGGDIQVECVVGEGSRLYVTLPLEVTEAVAEPVERNLELLRDLTVLIVDDNTTNRRIQRETIEGWSMRAIEAASGADALQQLRVMEAEDNLPKIVLSDMNMPHMDGLMLAERVRQSYSHDTIIFILLTSGFMPDDRKRVKDLEIAAVLLKPVKQSELLDTLLLALMDRGESIEQIVQDSAEPNLRSPQSLSVLLAEDGLANQKLAVGLLERWGHRVTIAPNGLDAIKAWENDPFDLILMDLQMPEMDGITATKIIRQREQVSGNHIPIIAMTAHALEGDRQRCLDAGMDGYVSKPVRKSDLAEAIAPWFGSNDDRENEPVRDTQNQQASD